MTAIHQRGGTRPTIYQVAEAAGVSLTEGLFQRLERMLAMMIGLLIPGAMLPVLILLATLGTVTLVQRSWAAVRGA